MKNNLFKTTILVLLLLSNSEVVADKKLLMGKHLKLVGGYTIPKVTFNKVITFPSYLDLLPNTKRWAAAHPEGYVLELIEPAKMGTGDSYHWPKLEVVRTTQALHDIEKISPIGVLWLNESEIATSGRKSYRSGFTDTWLSIVNVKSGKEQRYPIRAKSNTENDNFHIIQALGSGFMRVPNANWSKENIGGAQYLLGRGGYDVLGSPLGPALAKWNRGDTTVNMLLDFPKETPARRDPYYAYPEKDPKTSHLAHIPMWKMPDDKGGFWQGGTIGSITMIDHPSIKGIIYSHNFGRGIHDYRAQGDGGSGKYFLVDNPTFFYTDKSWGSNRGNHESETLNSSYPKGINARTGNVIDPDFLTESYTGKKEFNEAKIGIFDWPRTGLTWKEESKNSTRIGSLTWDSERQLLWAVIAARRNVKLVAYQLVDDDTRPEPPLIITEELKSFFSNSEKNE
jgi:hypothetical protein